MGTARVRGRGGEGEGCGVGLGGERNYIGKGQRGESYQAKGQVFGQGEGLTLGVEEGVGVRVGGGNRKRTGRQKVLRGEKGG